MTEETIFPFDETWRKAYQMDIRFGWKDLAMSALDVFSYTSEPDADLERSVRHWGNEFAWLLMVDTNPTIH